MSLYVSVFLCLCLSLFVLLVSVCLCLSLLARLACPSLTLCVAVSAPCGSTFALAVHGFFYPLGGGGRGTCYVHFQGLVFDPDKRFDPEVCIFASIHTRTYVGGRGGVGGWAGGERRMTGIQRRSSSSRCMCVCVCVRAYAQVVDKASSARDDPPVWKGEMCGVTNYEESSI
jgi:hypothetical protein